MLAEGPGACQAIDQCVALCGGATDCEQQCYAGNPDGLAAYNAVEVWPILHEASDSL